MFVRDRLADGISGGQRSYSLGRIYRTLTEIREKALVPAIIYTVQRTDALNTRHNHNDIQSPSLAPKAKEPYGARRLLILLTLSAAVALGGWSNAGATLALGCCEALLVVQAFAFIQDAQREASGEEGNSVNIVAVNGFLSASTESRSPSEAASLSVIRDVAMAATATLGAAAFVLEDLTFSRFRHVPALTTGRQQFMTIVLGVAMIFVHIALNASLVTAVCTILLHLISYLQRLACYYLISHAFVHASDINPSRLRLPLLRPRRHVLLNTDTFHGIGLDPKPIACRIRSSSFCPVRPTQCQPYHLRCMVHDHLRIISSAFSG